MSALVACEESQAACKAFRALWHEAPRFRNLKSHPLMGCEDEGGLTWKSGLLL